MTADESGVYFGSHLQRLDPNTDVFTRWNGIGIDVRNYNYKTVDGDIYSSSRGYIPDSPTQLNVTQFSKFSNDLVISGEKASGVVRVEITSPSNITKTGSTYVEKDATFSVEFNDFFDSYSGIFDYESGTYVINASDIFSTAEAVFEIDKTSPINYGQEPAPVSSTSKVFLQKLDPENNRLTLFTTNLDLDRFNPDLIISDHSSNLYMLDSLSRNHAGGDFFTTMSILKFSPDDNTVTYWHDIQDKASVGYSTGISHIAVSPEDKIYWGYNAGRNALQIVELDMETGIISEVTAPYRCDDQHYIRGMSVDSLGSIFFTGCDYEKLHRFTPPDTFTEFDIINWGSLSIDSSTDIIYATTKYNHKYLYAAKILPSDPANVTISVYDTNTVKTYPSYGVFTNNPEIRYKIDFNKHVTRLESDDISISGTADASVERLSSHHRGGVINVLAQSNGTVTVEIPECAVTDRRNVCNDPSSAHTTTVDTVPPTISSVSLDNTGTEITITASEILICLEIDDGCADDFEMSDNTVSSVTISENTIIIMLEEAIPANTTRTITHDADMDMIDMAGNYLGDFEHVIQN